MVVKEEAPKIIREEIEYNETQELMLKWSIAYPNIRCIYCHGGVRSGKSLGLCKIAQIISQKFPMSKTLIARDTRVNLKNTTLKTFFGYDFFGRPVVMPQLYRERDYNKTEGYLKWLNGSETYFWGMENPDDISRVKSTEWSAILIEEADALDVAVIQFLLETRLSHPQGPHKMMLTSNTDTGHSDLYRLFYETHDLAKNPGEICDHCGIECEFRTIPSTTLGNEQNLPDNYVRRIKRMEFSDPRMYKVYVMGEFMEFTKKIFPEFDQNTHIVDIPASWVPPPGSHTVYGYDHGYGGAPSCLVECLLLPDGTFLFWDEMWLWDESKNQSYTVMEMQQMFKDRDIQYIDAADPSIRNKTQYRENGEGAGELCSVQDLYTTYQISMELANNDVSGGIEKMKSLLIDDAEHQHPVYPEIDHCPHLLIARRGGQNKCPNLTRQFLKYRNKTNARGEVNATKWDPVKKDDHAIDPARYIINSPLSASYIRDPLPEEGTVAWVKHHMKEKIRKEQTGEREVSEWI